MKICAIQQPYPYTPEEAPAAVQFVIDELNSCDESIDLIVTPEYTNCPTKFPPGESLPFAIAHTRELVDYASAGKRFSPENTLAVWLKDGGTRYGNN